MSQANETYQKLREAVAAIQKRTQHKPVIGVILGSGLGSIAQAAEQSVTIPYSEIPHFHSTSVEGHAGQIIIGIYQGVPTVFLQGRFHLYEGFPMSDVAFPTRVICALGIETLILTNAAGGINARFRPGDIMLIEDHLNLMGNNPLIGPNLSQLGPRFPDLSEAYSKNCIEILEGAAQELSITLQKGVYVGLLGPTYETPAEVRMLRILGADAVGMSTVPETIAANHLGVRVAGISCIANLAAGMMPQKVTHQEVIENSKLGVGKIESLLKVAIPRMVNKRVST